MMRSSITNALRGNNKRVPYGLYEVGSRPMGQFWSRGTAKSCCFTYRHTVYIILGTSMVFYSTTLALINMEKKSVFCEV
jgi:hypothetical protein